MWYAIDSDGLDLSTSRTTIEVPLEGHARWRYTWPVQATRPGIAAVIVQALSDQDRRLSGYRLWPTSFREACGIRVLTSWSVRVRLVGLSIGSLDLGVIFCLPWLWGRARRRESERAG